MTTSRSYAEAVPIADINTTPLIDVLLVLLVMILLSVPLATHALIIELPSSKPPPPIEISPIINKVSVTSQDTVTFNGQEVSLDALLSLLRTAAARRPEPELQFQPDPAASYDTSIKVLRTIKQAGVTAFGIVGNDQYMQFGKAPAHPGPG